MVQTVAEGQASAQRHQDRGRDRGKYGRMREIGTVGAASNGNAFSLRNTRCRSPFNLALSEFQRLDGRLKSKQVANKHNTVNFSYVSHKEFIFFLQFEN